MKALALALALALAWQAAAQAQQVPEGIVAPAAYQGDAQQGAQQARLMDDTEAKILFASYIVAAWADSALTTAAVAKGTGQEVNPFGLKQLTACCGAPVAMTVKGAEHVAISWALMHMFPKKPRAVKWALRAMIVTQVVVDGINVKRVGYR